MFLHAHHASHSGHQCIVIKSFDTDLCGRFLWLPTSKHPCKACPSELSTSRLIDVQGVCDHLGTDLCKALLDLHAFTGCDSVSAFVGKVKRKARGLVQNDISIYEQVFRLFEMQYRLRKTTDMAKQEEFVFCLYEKPGPSVNDIRCYKH